MIIFTKLSNRFSQERVFYIMTSGFLLFFALFAFVLYPNRDFLHPNELAAQLDVMLPQGFRGLVSVFRNWTFTIFYVFAELWISVVLHVLFWGFANEVTRIGEARRFYSVLGLAGNFSAIMAGQVSIYLPMIPMSYIPFIGAKEGWEQVQMILVSLVILCGIATMLTFRWINRNVLTDPSFDRFHHNKRELKSKGKLSFRESFSYLANSKYLLCIAVLVIAYNLVINLAEVVWKDQLRLLYPDHKDFNTYMNNLTTAIGIFSTLAALFMAKLIERFGWTKIALITPMIMLVTCAGFFSFLIFQDSLASFAIAVTGTTPLAIAVFFGGAQNCLSKASKYSVFDATKEMAYIPLSPECRIKGKAAIDGVGSRFGKSGGSLFHQGLLILFDNSFIRSAPYIAGVLGVVIGLWILATQSLGRQFNALLKPSDGFGETAENTEAAESVSTPRVSPAL
jgi:AAA family ATP:ADP antiporter